MVAPTAQDVQPVANETRDRIATGIVTAVPFIALFVVGWQLWNDALHLERSRRVRDLLRRDRARGDGRLPPPPHPSRVPVQALGARHARDPRLRRDRGPGDLVGRRPPQAPRVLRPGGRPAQPARRPRRRLHGSAARPIPRSRGLAVHPHAPRQQGALRARPDQGPADPLGRPHVRALGRGRAARAVRPRLPDRRHVASGAHRHAVGRRRAHAGRPPRHLQHQLALPLLRPPGVRHRRRVAQPRVAGAVHVRRGLAQQPPRVPDLVRARDAVVAGRSVPRRHPADGAHRAGLGRRDGSARIARAAKH